MQEIPEAQLVVKVELVGGNPVCDTVADREPARQRRHVVCPFGVES